MKTSLLVSEVFGPTVQGEGPLVGTPATFLRLMACNLACSWCDTPYTWDAKRFDLRMESHRMTVDQVANAVIAVGTDLVVITGGEPLLQQDRLADLLPLLHRKRVQVETAGTIAPRLRGVEYVVSPKLMHSGNAALLRYRPEAIDAFAGWPVLAWKFVLQQPSDYSEVDDLVRTHHLAPVHIMAEGTDPAVLAERMAALVPGAIERGFTITPRLHIDLWGNGRGH